MAILAFEYGFQYRGIGGLVTNLIDLWRWRQGLTSGKLLKEESLQEMLRPGPHDYALGWRINDLDDGRIVHEHTGKVRGFLASVRLDPTSDGGLFVLANSDDSLPFELVKSGCEAALAGAKPSATLSLERRLAQRGHQRSQSWRASGTTASDHDSSRQRGRLEHDLLLLQ